MNPIVPRADSPWCLHAAKRDGVKSGSASAGRRSVVMILPDPVRRFLVSPSIAGRARGAPSLLMAALLLGCATAPPGSPPHPPPAAQEETPALRPGVTVERSLSPDGRDEIPLPLEAGRYLRVAFETPLPHDLTVSLLDPQRQVISETAGSDGQLSLITSADGAYRIAVEKSDSQAKVSSYRITILDARQVQPGDEDRVSAEKALSEAKLLEMKERYAEGIEKAKASLDRWSKLQDFRGELEAQYELGALYDRAGEDKGEALRWYRQALLTAQGAGDRR